jgi:hypothetical protein
MCAICLEDIKNEDECCMITGCEHKFHKDCMTNLLIYSSKWNCPLCRRDFLNVIDLADEDEIKVYKENKLKGLYDKKNEEISPIINLNYDNDYNYNYDGDYDHDNYFEPDNSDRMEFLYYQREQSYENRDNLDQDEIEFEYLFQSFLTEEQENTELEMSFIESMTQ